MDGERPSPSSSALYIGGGDRGIGGKFRKPPLRKKPATPYDRPPTANQPPQRRDGGWLSKLVDPACRLIAGGATRILPSFFSRSPSTSDLTPSDSDDLGLPGTDDWGTDATTNASNDDNRALNLAISQTNGEAGPSKGTDRLKDNSECDELEQDNTRNLCDDSELSKIEQLVKGKRFSRDEIDRLTEILNSRVVDIVDVEQENKEPCLNIGGEAKMTSLANGSPIMLVDGKQEDMNGAILGTSTPHLQSNMRDAVVASPVDIARAYMGSRTSEMGLGSYSIRGIDERALQQGDELASRLFLPPPSPKSSICWPGAVVQDQRGYTTPQTQRGKFGLHNLPRTPYSRTIFSKSKGKLTQLQADSRSFNITSTAFQQSRTPIYGQVKSRIDVADDGYGSVGPIRRLRNKFASETPPRGSTSLYSVQNSPPQVEKASVSKGFLPIMEKNLERGGTSSTLKYQSVDHMTHDHAEGAPLNSPSNETVRKILEQLDRHKPTPKEKEAEMKLATAWKRPPSEGTDFMPKENTSLGHLGGLDSNKNSDLVDQKFSAEGNDGRGKLNFTPKPLQTDIVTKASGIAFGDHGLRHEIIAGPSGVKKTSDSPITTTTHEKDSLVTNSVSKNTSQLWPFHSQANGQDVTTRAPSGPRSDPQEKPPLGTKPNLKHIFVNKPDPKRIVSFDNGLGFTFPISETSGVLSEPPTPSIMPSFSAGGPPQPKEGPIVPTYSFGTKKATPRLVFSFPSTSDASKGDVEGSDIKFNFGSDKKSRVSFSSVGKDAICF